MNTILSHWRPSEGRKTHLAVVLYGEMKSGGDDHMMKLATMLIAAGGQYPHVEVHLVAIEPRKELVAA